MQLTWSSADYHQLLPLLLLSFSHFNPASMFHVAIQPLTATVSTAPSALRKRKAAEVVESSLQSNARLRDSLAANTGPSCPDDNGKSKPRTALDASSPGSSKRRRSSGVGSAEHENSAPAVDASNQGSSGYVPLVTSFFSNVISWTTSLFSSADDSAAASEVHACSSSTAASGFAGKSTRTVVQTKAFALAPGSDLMNEMPSR